MASSGGGIGDRQGGTKVEASWHILDFVLVS